MISLTCLFEVLLKKKTSAFGNYKLPAGNTIFIPETASILDLDPFDLFLKTTIYLGTAPLQTPWKQSAVINHAFRKSQNRYPSLISHLRSDVNHLKCCPLCCRGDMERYGNTWLRRVHHMPGVECCHIHGVMLKKVKIDHGAIENQMIFTDPETIKASAAEIRTGSRCTCTPTPSSKEQPEYVYMRSCGVYEAVPAGKKGCFVVRNTETGVEQVLHGRRIIQELERPTPSPLVPLEVKGSYTIASRVSKFDAAIEYLDRNVGDGNFFHVSVLKNTGLTSNQISDVVTRFKQEGVFEPVKGNGCYVYHKRKARSCFAC